MNWHTGEHANTWIQTLWWWTGCRETWKNTASRKLQPTRTYLYMQDYFQPNYAINEAKVGHTHRQSAAVFFLLNCFLASDISPESAEPNSLIFFSFPYLILIPMCLCNI